LDADEHFLQKSDMFNVALDSNSVCLYSFIVTGAVSDRGWINFKGWYVGVVVVFFMELTRSKVKGLHFVSSHFDFFKFVEECLFQVHLVRDLVVDVEHISNCLHGCDTE